MSAKLTLETAKSHLRGLGAAPTHFGDADEAWCCYGRTAAAGLITITFGREPTKLTVGSTDYVATDKISMAMLIERYVPTRAKIEAAESAASAPRARAKVKWAKPDE